MLFRSGTCRHDFRIHISELELLTIGTVNDMYTEMNNDENREAYSTLASQEDMDAF